MKKTLIKNKVFRTTWFFVLGFFVTVCVSNTFGQGSIKIPIPNGTSYPSNGSTVITAFCLDLDENYTANFVVLDCLDDRNNGNSEPAAESFEVAITSDIAGTIVLGTARQLDTDFGCTFGNCDKHRYLFDIGDVTLSSGITYYLRTKVLAGAPVKFWGAARLYYDGGLPVGNKINVHVPNGTLYNTNGSTNITSFSLSQTSTARCVILDCLDDRNSPDTEPDTETFEVAITTNSAGTNVIASAQEITADFGAVFGNCDRRRHLFDIGDATLTGGVTYYLRTKVLAGAPVKFWGFSYLYYDPLSNYMKITSPPDVDKLTHGHSGTSTCWLATAANMLAGAGYGGTGTYQARADAIYTQLVTNYGTGGGWTDTALTWWLSSANNTWTANPYDLVTIYGNKTKTPWANTNGARFMGNELRRCQMLGLSLTWPRTTAGGSPSKIGHAITCWGDSGGGANLTGNPASVRVCDSDTDTGGNVQVYNYDSYTNPNPAPGNFDEGNGWYISYNSNHPFIKHIVTLCSIAEGCDDGDGTRAGRSNSSYKIHQDRTTHDAIGLYYEVGASYDDILDYETAIDWEVPGEPNESGVPTIEADGCPPELVKVTYDLSANPVPYCNWVSLNNSLIVGDTGNIRYDSVKFIYSDGEVYYPGFEMGIMDYTATNPSDPNITGGYVIGAFDIIDTAGPTVVGEHRFLHQYFAEEDPEQHDFSLHSDITEPGYAAGNFRFGHVYGCIEPNSLEEFSEWMTIIATESPIGNMESPINININWTGQLPYPEAENYQGEYTPEPECSYYLPEDLNFDCYVNLEDFVKLSAVWLEDTVP